MSAELSKVSQYGNEAPGAPSLQAELAKLREENSVLKRSAKGVNSFVSVIFVVFLLIFVGFCKLLSESGTNTGWSKKSQPTFKCYNFLNF